MKIRRCRIRRIRTGLDVPFDLLQPRRQARRAGSGRQPLGACGARSTKEEKEVAGVDVAEDLAARFVGLADGGRPRRYRLGAGYRVHIGHDDPDDAGLDPGQLRPRLPGRSSGRCRPGRPYRCSSFEPSMSSWCRAAGDPDGSNRATTMQTTATATAPAASRTARPGINGRAEDPWGPWDGAYELPAPHDHHRRLSGPPASVLSTHHRSVSRRCAGRAPTPPSPSWPGYEAGRRRGRGPWPTSRRGTGEGWRR